MCGTERTQRGFPVPWSSSGSSQSPQGNLSLCDIGFDTLRAKLRSPQRLLGALHLRFWVTGRPQVRVAFTSLVVGSSIRTSCRAARCSEAP